MPEYINFNCGSCGKRLRVAATLSETTGRCPGCKASVTIDYESIKRQSELPKTNPIAIVRSTVDDQMLGALYKLLTPPELKILNVTSMTGIQRKTLEDWGMRMYGLGKNVASEIDTIKFDGRLVILEDGSRWEVHSSDSYVADGWMSGDRVVVIDNEMFRLDDSEKVGVDEGDD